MTVATWEDKSWEPSYQHSISSNLTLTPAHILCSFYFLSLQIRLACLLYLGNLYSMVVGLSISLGLLNSCNEEGKKREAEILSCICYNDPFNFNKPPDIPLLVLSLNWGNECSHSDSSVTPSQSAIENIWEQQTLSMSMHNWNYSLQHLSPTQQFIGPRLVRHVTCDTVWPGPRSWSPVSQCQLIPSLVSHHYTIISFYSNHGSSGTTLNY